ncbi:MAG: hypothetical protein PWQ82_165 [Thermosediminibacterales bacterium]|nr:hypothetical protein [Thermosediminibacterales bacterium]MDK2835330.1 hypothetical protein [Thermosediminibacterales bacterium]
MNTVILADSCSDLPLTYIEQQNIPVVNFSFNFMGQEYFDDFGKTISYKKFYDAVRAGEMSTTSQVNVHTFTEIFNKYIEDGKSIIYLAFSSALSGTYNNALLARNMILEDHPEADIHIIDTKSASLGEGLLVYYAIDMLTKGIPGKEIVDWIENNKLRLNHWFTVEDLGHLKRGGRLSGTAAFIGTVLNIKPVLHVDNAGRLVPVTKTKGRKKSIKTLVDMMEERIVDPENQVIAISHGDCLDDVQYLKELVLERVKVKDIIINHIGPVIGSHVGPGTLALFFLGKGR